MADEYWVASWENNGVPKTGLAPTIEIIELPDTLVKTGEIMTEMVNLPGTYYYLHTTYDPTKNYVARADSIVTTVSQRYTYASNSDDLQISDKIPIDNFMGSTVKTPKDDEIDSILSDTNELQGKVDAIDSKIDIVDSNVDSILEDTSITIPASLANIQADLDNPNQYKADVSDLATEANATTNTASINTNIDNNETKIDTIDTKIDAIKLKTDNLPADTEAILNTIEQILLRDIGLSHENIHQDHTFVGGLHTKSEVYLYDSKANTELHDGVTGLEENYTLTIEYSGTNPISHTMVKN